jgi:hypothetical protein
VDAIFLFHFGGYISDLKFETLLLSGTKPEKFDRDRENIIHDK